MTLTRIKSTGKGRLNARLVIEGLDHCFVSSARMERAADSQGRPWVNGLLLDGMKLGAKADIMRARLDGETLNVRIADLDRIAGKRHGRVTRALTRIPTARAYLAADLTASATTATLLDTSSLPSSGVVHINTEAIAYSGKTSTTLTGLTRAWFQTAAQAHYVADGEGLLDALVTDLPVSLEGRRVYLYLYGDGDSPTGNGNLRWRGFVSSDVAWSDGICSLSVDPITRLLDQPIGGDLGGTVTPRGIKYTTVCPFVVTVIEYPSGLEEVRATAELTGFWETQEEFCDAINTQIAGALATAGISLGDGFIKAQARAQTIDIVYVTDSASPNVIDVLIHDDIAVPSAIESTTSVTNWYGSDGDIATRMGDRGWTPAVSTRYYFPISAPMPRGSLGRRTYFDPYRRSAGVPSSTAAEYLLPLAGTVIPTAGSVLLERDDDEAAPIRVSSVSDRDVYIEPSTVPSGILFYTATTAFVLGRFVAAGSVLDLVDELDSSSPGLANTGAMPLVLAEDVEWTQDLEDSVASQPLAQGRSFYAFEDAVSVGEYVEPELLVLGAYQRLSLTGAIEWARMAPPLATDESVYSVDDSSRMSIARSPDGILGHVLYRMGYDPREDEWDERTITYRDVQATAPTRIPVVLEVAQRSTRSGSWRASNDWVSVDRTDIARMAMNAFALYGTPITVIVAQTDARYMDARIGDIVTVSSEMLPDPTDGCSAIVDRPGIVIGHTLDLKSGAVELAILAHAQRFVAYNLGLPISLETPPVNTTGTTWELALDTSGYTDATTIATLIDAGDLIVITEGDSASPTEVTGTVDSVDSATTLTVTLSGAWTPGSSEWFLRARAASAYAADDNRALYAFCAGSDARIGFSGGDEDAQVFA